MLRDSAEDMTTTDAPVPRTGVESTAETLFLRDFMNDSAQGWGREQGRAVYGGLLTFVESRPGQLIFLVSMKGVDRADISFASETVVELARRYRCVKGLALKDLTDVDMLENWEAAASRKHQPLMVHGSERAFVIGSQPSQGNVDAFHFALKYPSVRATQFATATKISIANASMKFKQLWEQGFLLRRECVAESGGIEFVYFQIG
jgi:hypothetical protein